LLASWIATIIVPSANWRTGQLPLHGWAFCKLAWLV